MKFSQVATNSGPAPTDYLMGVTAAGVDFRALLSDVLKTLYPVGSVYSNVSSSTNPGTLFGFGTWVAIQGQTIAGYSSGDTNFGTPGASVGAANHWHWQTVGADSNEIYAENAAAGSGQTRVIGVGGAGGLYSNRDGFATGGANIREDGTYTASSIQPTLTVYMWQRTA